MPAKKLYIGCSLTQATPEFRRAVEDIKNELRGEFEVLDFLGLEKGTAADVYHNDIGHNIAECDLFVAICDYPAIGLGYELGAAIEKHRKPVLAVAQQDALVSRLVLGIDHPAFSFERYGSLADVPDMIRAKASHIH